jgi:phenylacetate-coenzyme A ligase PaaK-like adenylate-forming protein
MAWLLMLDRPRYQARRMRELVRGVRLGKQLESHDRMRRSDVETLQQRSLRRLAALDRPDDYYLGRYRAMTTGGSSGKKGVFVFDRRKWSVVLALTLRWSRLMGVGPRLPNRIRSAAIAAGNPLHITYRVAVTADVGLAKILCLDATTPIPRLVADLNDFQPEHLHAYPSIAALLADEQEAGRLRISPRVVSTSSELRTEEMTERIRAAWRTEPFDCYGITEVGLFGNDCEYHRGIHARALRGRQDATLSKRDRGVNA